jgi:hypothetical protein
MKDFEIIEEAVIDLGQASVETKGDAVYDIDDGGGPRLFTMGISED